MRCKRVHGDMVLVVGCCGCRRHCHQEIIGTEAATVVGSLMTQSDGEQARSWCFC
jgi:hypothetical protein